MSDITETKAAPPRRFASAAGIRPGRTWTRRTWTGRTWTAETWAIVLSVAFIALIVAGVFPRVPW